MSPLVSVPGTGTVQEPELVVREVEHQSPQFLGVGGGTWAMIGIKVLVDSPGIVKHGKQAHHIDIRTRLFGQTEAVLQHSGPVSNAVVAAPRKDILFENSVEDQAEILCHDDPLGGTS
jgi:hypothetical protein